MLSLDMPLYVITAERRGRFHNLSRLTRGLTRGVCRMLTETGFGPITEFRLPNRRRADVMGLGSGSEFVIVEVKSSVADFRSDTKWPDYLPYCDRFYFAVAEGFPIHILPDDCGILVADSYGAAIRREAPEQPITAIRRQRQLLRFALTASERLNRLSDPRQHG